MLAYLQGEGGAEVVESAMFDYAAISIVNWAEVLSKVVEAGGDPARVGPVLVERGVLGAGLSIWPVSDEMAVEIARLRPLTRSAGLSLGDRACLSLGRALDLPVYTAEHRWNSLSLGMEIREIR